MCVAVNCWPSVSGNETYVSIEYEASSMFDLRNVVISVPLPALREAPTIRQIDGEWRSNLIVSSPQIKIRETMSMICVYCIEVCCKECMVYIRISLLHVNILQSYVY